MKVQIKGLAQLAAALDAIRAGVAEAVERSLDQARADLDADLHKYDAQLNLSYRLGKIRDHEPLAEEDDDR